MTTILIGGGIVAVILIIGAVLLMGARRDGEASQRSMDLEATADVEKAMLRAALNAPSDAAGVSGSLHRHDF